MVEVAVGFEEFEGLVGETLGREHENEIIPPINKKRTTEKAPLEYTSTSLRLNHPVFMSREERYERLHRLQNRFRPGRGPKQQKEPLFYRSNR